MKCPNCGAPEKARVKVCSSCNHAYASQDLLELSKIEYLLEESKTWRVSESLLKPYKIKLEALKERLLPKPIEKEEPVVPEPSPVKVAPVAADKPVPKAVPTPAPPKERVPFDQWLLSERNIKLALYSGAGLLILAGLIFVGVNWARFPGPAKFVVTLLIAGLMYLGGYLLFQRPTLKLGGNALLAIASGFFALNFVVLQMYVVGDLLTDEVMWLIASPICLLLYLFTTYWTKSDLFTYFSLVAVASTLTATLVVTGAPALVYVLAYTLLMIVILWLSRLVIDTPIADFTFSPFKWVSQIGMPFLIVAAMIGWGNTTGCPTCNEGNPWLSIVSLFVGVIFYVVSNVFFKEVIFRWAAVIILTISISFVMFEFDFSDTAMGVTSLILAFIYLWIGYFLENREEDLKGRLPLYIIAYIVAFMVTIVASSDAEDFAKILLGDVVLLGFSAYVHKNYRWVYGAAWLFMWPVYIYIALTTSDIHQQGLLMSLLWVTYIVVGFVLGQRELRLGGPFLTAAAFLSITTVMMTWGVTLTSCIVLAVAAVLYLFAALWRNWPILLYPSLLAVNLLVLQLNYLVAARYPSVSALIISYTLLGVMCVLGGRGLQRPSTVRWAAPLFLAGVVDLVGTYPASLFEGGILAVSISAVVASLLLVFAWLEYDIFVEKKIPTFLPYLGVIVIFIGHFYLIDLLGSPGIWDIWPGITVGVCALFAILSWLMKGTYADEVYGIPLRLVGLGLMTIPVIGAVIVVNQPIPIITLFICGTIYLLETAMRREVLMSYFGIGALFAGHFYLLDVFDILDTRYTGILVWPVFTTGLCALFVVLSWLMRGKKDAEIFESPFRLEGLGWILIPLAGSLVIFDPIPVAVTFAIAGFILVADAVIRKKIDQAYLGIASFIVVIWAIWKELNIYELQAFVVPVGLALLGMGWYERIHVQGRLYRVFTMLGLLLLMGSAFIQSLPRDAWDYALLLVIESIISIAWGVRKHLRGFVQLGVFALLANAVVQLGPGFMNLGTWIKIGIIGSVLLGSGLLALFKRDQILRTRRKLTDEWKSWEP